MQCQGVPARNVLVAGGRACAGGRRVTDCVGPAFEPRERSSSVPCDPAKNALRLLPRGPGRDGHEPDAAESSARRSATCRAIGGERSSSRCARCRRDRRRRLTNIPADGFRRRAGAAPSSCSAPWPGHRQLPVLRVRRPVLTPAEFAEVSAMTGLATIAFMPATGSRRHWRATWRRSPLVASRSRAQGLIRAVTRRVAVLQAGLLLVLVVGTCRWPSSASRRSGSGWSARCGSFSGSACRSAWAPIEGANTSGAWARSWPVPWGCSDRCSSSRSRRSRASPGHWGRSCWRRWSG